MLTSFISETNLLGSGQPQQMGYHDNSIRPHSDVEHPPSQRSLVDLATTVTPTDQIEVVSFIKYSKYVYLQDVIPLLKLTYPIVLIKFVLIKTKN